MLITRRLNCTDAASGIVTVSKWPSGAQVETENGILRSLTPWVVTIYSYIDVSWC